MSSVIQLKVLGAAQPARTAVIVAQSGSRMLLRTTDGIAPGALIEAHAGGRVILGEVAQSRVLDDGIEISVESHHSFNRSWQPPQPAWQGVGALESVLDSLLALNRQLERLTPAEAAPRRQPQSETAARSVARRVRP
jgi:hypothetical protein